ncbi:CopG family transcriptional regulator [Amycolatopsis thailandensis]|uniref:CopG family transcriptional regulator n=1 Tax=Amycolatopsis thailandensis TaxID=589330 RepID=UPI0036373199
MSDDDLVSFNCKMSRGLRRSVRHFAADAEVDIQDVVAAALEEYLEARGIDIPGVDQRQPG